MPEIYRSQHAGSIADLMRQRGASAAQHARQLGDLQAQRSINSGQAIQGITQAVTGTLRDFAQQRQEAPVMALRQRQADQLAAELSAMETATAQKRIGELASMVRASNYDPATAEPVFRAIAKLSPDYEQPLMRSLMEPAMLKNVTDTLISQTPGYKVPEGFTLGEGQTRFGPDGKQIANVPKPEPVQQPFTLSPGSSRFNPDGTPIASVPATPPAVNLRPEDVLLDGKPAKAVFNPQTGKYTVNGEDVTSRVQPLPPKEPQAPTTRYSPRTVVVNGQTIEANYDALTGKYHDPNTNAVLTGVQTAPTADMRNKEAAKKPAAHAVDAVRKLGEDIFKNVGPTQRADAIRRGVEAVFGNDPKFRTYQDSRMALAGTLAVEQQGSRVSDADVRALWLPMIPDAYRDTAESYKLKWELIDKMRGIETKDDPNAFDEEWVFDSKGNLVKKPK